MVPVKPYFSESRTLPRCDSGVPRDALNCMGTIGNVFNYHLLKKDYLLQSPTNSKNLEPSLRNRGLGLLELQGGESEMKRESRNTSVFVTPFPLNHTGGTWSHSGMMDFSRVPITEMHLGKFPDWNFEAGKSSSRLRFAQEQQQILGSLCIGTTKMRLQSQLTNLCRSDQLCGEPISLTSICLMR